MVKPSEAPEYKGATIGLLVGYAIKAVCHISLFCMTLLEPPAHLASESLLMILVYMLIVNRSRESRYGPADKARSNEAGMQDQTEFENKDFRYVL